MDSKFQSDIYERIRNETSQWVREIFNQKAAQNNTANFSTQQNASSTFATTQTSQTSATIPPSIGGQGSKGSSGSGTDTQIPTPPDSGTWVLASIDGEVQWIETQDC